MRRCKKSLSLRLYHGKLANLLMPVINYPTICGFGFHCSISNAAEAFLCPREKVCKRIASLDEETVWLSRSNARWKYEGDQNYGVTSVPFDLNSRKLRLTRDLALTRGEFIMINRSNYGLFRARRAWCNKTKSSANPNQLSDPFTPHLVNSTRFHFC